MAAQGAKIVLEGSERKRLSRAHDAGSPPPDERLEVAVVVRRRPLVGDADPRKTVAQRRLSASADSFEAASTGSLGERKPMARWNLPPFMAPTQMTWLRSRSSPRTANWWLSKETLPAGQCGYLARWRPSAMPSL